MVSKSSLGYEMILKKKSISLYGDVAECSNGSSFWPGLKRFWARCKGQLGGSTYA